MSGILGWVRLPDSGDARTLDAMIARASRVDSSRFESAAGPGHALAAGGLGRTSGLFLRHGRIAALQGHPYWDQSGRRYTQLQEVAERLLDAFAERGVAALASLHGDYAVAILHPSTGDLILAVDRMSTRNIVYAATDDGIAFGPTCDVVLLHPAVRRNVDVQGIYNFVYFHMVPGPATVFAGLKRIPPGHRLQLDGNGIIVLPGWRAHFVEDVRGDFGELKREFRSALERSVRTFAADEACGAFLSGGTDSSTLTGLLGATTGKPAQTFSIGFAAEGYDEMHYARVAARHFRAAHHEYYVTPQDVIDAIPRIAATYDQPFGNASAVPTYYCAKLAREHGISRMLGGDGGDELYGGNSRYAQQHRFALYEKIPALLRSSVVEPIARRVPDATRFTLLRKARSYVAQASQPMPERYDTYNLLERLGPANVFTAEFLATVDRGAPIRHLRDVYGAADAQSLVNRMLALDFQITLADNDLPKVTRMCELAAVDVAFPMLHDDVIDFSLKLTPEWKLRGTTLRYFFKEALKDFLPGEIIAKQKHGFGLPVGTWLQNSAGLRTLAGDNLATLRRRGIIRPDFIDRLQSEHLAIHPGYYGTMIWVLMMLELWFQLHASG